MNQGKVVIMGTGRAGTSFLIMLLTRLGFDTGFKPYLPDFNTKIMAGSEYKIFSTNLKQQQNLLKKAPRVIKHPKFSLKLKNLLKKKLIKVDHLIIPVRDLKIAAQSRITARRPWTIKGIEPGEKTLGYVLGKAVETAVLFDIPTTLIHYPRLILNENYCFTKLKPIFKLNRQQFSKIYQQLADPKLIKAKIENKPINPKPLIKPHIGIVHKILYRLF